MIRIERTNSNNAGFRRLFDDLDDYLNAEYGLERRIYNEHNIIDYLNTVVIAYDDEKEPIGCGCFRVADERSAEIKRFYVAPDFRGTNTAQFIFDEIEAWAIECGLSLLFLETGDRLLRAIRFYQKNGYSITSNYGPYIGLETSVCMKKSLKLSDDDRI